MKGDSRDSEDSRAGSLDIRGTGDDWEGQVSIKREKQ